MLQEEEIDEFNINNFPDLSERGKKKQCFICNEWDYCRNLSSEYGTSWYHPSCAIKYDVDVC